MAGQTEHDFEVAWNALSSLRGDGEWSLIAIRQPRDFTIYAARYRPENLEALVIGLPQEALRRSRTLPEGGGFEVTIADIDLGPDLSAIALVRSASGPPDIFCTMVVDLLNLLDRDQGLPALALASRFLERVTAWQSFMQPPHNGPLSTEAQTGLFGELLFLQDLLSGRMPGQSAVGAWDGPMHGAKDFRFDSGAVEVKTSTAAEGFAAKIQSLEQLDDSDCRPLFLVALRLAEDPHAQSLPDLVHRIRNDLASQGASREFDGRLSAIGYHEDHEPHYGRRLALVQRRTFKIGPEFPRLFSGNVAPAIRRAGYEIEIDGIVQETEDDTAMFFELGLLKQWN